MACLAFRHADRDRCNLQSHFVQCVGCLAMSDLGRTGICRTTFGGHSMRPCVLCSCTIHTQSLHTEIKDNADDHVLLSILAEGFITNLSDFFHILFAFCFIILSFSPQGRKEHLLFVEKHQDHRPCQLTRGVTRPTNYLPRLPQWSRTMLRWHSRCNSKGRKACQLTAQVTSSYIW